MIPVKVTKSWANGKVAAVRCSNNVELIVNIEQLQVPEGMNTKVLETLYG